MDKRVVQRSIEHFFLLFRTAFHLDTRQVTVPSGDSISVHLVEVKSALLGVQIHSGVLAAHERNSKFDLYLLTLGHIVEAVPESDIVSLNLACISGVQFIFPLVFVPSSLSRHRTLFLPVSGTRRSLADTHHEIDWEHSLGIVAEGSQHLRAFDFGLAHLLHHCSGLVGKSLAEIYQYVRLTGSESISLYACAFCCCHLCLDAISDKSVGIISRRSALGRIFRAIFPVVHFKSSRCRHSEKRTQFRASHSAQIHVRETCKELIFIAIWSGPPSAVLVPYILVRTHNVERRNAHHTVRAYGTRICRAEVGCPDKRIHIPHRRILNISRIRQNSLPERKCQGKERYG